MTCDFVHFTVPFPECHSAPVSMRGIITVSWTYVHTGGLNITRVMIEYKDLSNEQFEGSKTVDETDLNDNSVPFSGFEAGSTYEFEITAYNGIGNANVACPPVLHEIGKYKFTKQCYILYLSFVQTLRVQTGYS